MKRLMLGMLIVGLVGFGLPGNASADLLGNTELVEEVAIPLNEAVDVPPVEEDLAHRVALEATLVVQASAAFVAAYVPPFEFQNPPPIPVGSEGFSVIPNSLDPNAEPDPLTPPPVPPVEGVPGDDGGTGGAANPPPTPPGDEPPPIPLDKDGYPLKIPYPMPLDPNVPPGPSHPGPPEPKPLIPQPKPVPFPPAPPGTVFTSVFPHIMNGVAGTLYTFYGDDGNGGLFVISTFFVPGPGPGTEGPPKPKPPPPAPPSEEETAPPIPKL